MNQDTIRAPDCVNSKPPTATLLLLRPRSRSTSDFRISPPQGIQCESAETASRRTSELQVSSRASPLSPHLGFKPVVCDLHTAHPLALHQPSLKSAEKNQIIQNLPKHTSTASASVDSIAYRTFISLATPAFYSISFFRKYTPSRRKPDRESHIHRPGKA